MREEKKNDLLEKGAIIQRDYETYKKRLGRYIKEVGFEEFKREIL